MTGRELGERVLLFAAMVISLTAIGSLGAPGTRDGAARPVGEPVLEPPTLRSLGVYWIVADDTDATRVELEWRAEAGGAWRPGAPLFRVEPGAHRAEGR